ncbi:MAG: tRNA pseudouridine(54/55) synthase Pus10 [Candidatus Bathyarchaeota archaeon]|nr:MAG: tRNA pseudouridine(54/55) synthase Pus10 [Candidatus Bathyarchaeota archaeon]
MNILEKAEQMLRAHPLCDYCLGRQFALLGFGLENKSRGKAIKSLLTMEGHRLLHNEELASSLLRVVAINGSFDMARDILMHFSKFPQEKPACFLCEGQVENSAVIAYKAIEELKGLEFSTFLVGVELPHRIAEREDEFKARFNVTHGESMKSQFSRNIGKQIYEITGKEVDYRKPDLVVLANPFTNFVQLQTNPVYVGGKYRKLVRGIPQSRWVCGECNGKGCEICSWTGKRYSDSIEELIGIPILKITKGEEMAFHGSGREDVDARMLGFGRPFVLEVKKPKTRFFDLKKLELTINDNAKGKIEVHDLYFANKNIIRRLKKAEANSKIYRMIVMFDQSISDEELQKIERVLSDVTIRQQTPQRVLHRRADLRRDKYIYKTKVKRLSYNQAELQIHCQGGLYIKELITGDKGRTNPSVASILRIKATPLQLDVLEIISGE